MKRSRWTRGWLALACLCVAAPAHAQVPQLLAYHGRLTQNNGVSLTGEHTVTFRIYDVEAGGAELWKESHQMTLTASDNGLFSAVLGSLKPLESINFNKSLWLSIEIDTEGEMTPRQRLAAVGYAINADTLDGLDSTQFARLDAASTMTKALTLTHAGVAVLIKPDVAPPANAKVVEIQTPTGETHFSVDAEGDVAVAGNLTVSGTVSGASVTSGTVTSVGSGNGLTGGPITSSGTLAVNLASGSGLAADTDGLSLRRTCSDGQLMKWASATSSWECAADADTNAGGTLTGVTAGTGLTGGGTSGDVTLNIGSGTGIVVGADSIAVNVGTGANQIVQLDANAKLPAVDGSALTNVNASTITDGLITAADTADAFLIAGSGATVTKGAASWTITATGTGGDITSVTAGTGLTDGGTSGDVMVALSTPVLVANGGTGAATLTDGGLLIGKGSSAVSTTGVLAKGSLIIGDGAADPAIVSVGSDRALLMADSTQTSGTRWAAGCMPVGGADDTSRSATFQMAAFGISSTTGRQDRLWPVPLSGTLSGLAAYVDVAPGSGKSWTVTLRKNGSNTNLTCTISGTSQTCTATGTVTFAAGNRLGAEFVEGGTANATKGAGWSACFIPD